MGLPGGIFWLLTIALILNKEYVSAQAKRSQSPRAGPSPRSLGSNPRTSSSSSIEFDCPEEFGYYPHPTDCSHYYVCVFGGALLESCTGGLMYSHELQTCDWQRNVDCKVTEVSAPSAPSRDVPRLSPQITNRIRYSPVTGPSAPSAPAHIQQIQTQQTLPPPPQQLRVAPNPVITSRGQPKNFQDEIINHYAEDTLPPAEEEESDRQQRVYRGQPSTVGQVQRDRDGILQQPSVNAIPNQAKVGSFAFGSQVPGYRVEQSSPAPNNYQPQKTLITQQKNYYNTTNFNPPQYDPYYSLYDDDVEIYRDVDYSHQYNQNQQKSTPTSTYRPIVSTTHAPPKQQTPVPQREQYVTQQPQQNYERPQQNVYSSADYDDALVAQLEEDARYGQQQSNTDQRGDRNEINLLPDRAIIKPLRKNVPKYSSPAFITLSTPEPFSLSTSGTRATTTSTAAPKTAAPQFVATRQQNQNQNQNNRNRGSSAYNAASDTSSALNRGTHPPRTRPTLKPAQSIVSKAQEFVDIYRFPPVRHEPLYPQPTPDKTAAKCRKDVCLLPDCSCGGKDIPADMPVEQVPQIVLLTFDDSVNDLNKGLYADLFERDRVNPNGCPIGATFYVSHEWTDYSQVQNLYANGHEMASHTVSHSFGEQFSLKKWAREVAGQREILSAYGGVKLEDVRGMRAPFLSVGGNKMFKMLHDFNFTYDSSMPVYENRPPSWPYTLDYKIFHDCMIPPCPTKSYPGVWEVPMVMWQDLNGGRCSMGDACSNPPDADGVYKMILKNFERHYTTNRAPFGLFYHAAWFTQPHHKEGFITFLDAINSMKDVFIVTNWQALQYIRDPTPLSRMNSFQPFQCDYSDRPKRCNNPKVCNLWHKSGVRYMRTCQPCPEIYPWTGKSGIRSSRIDNDLALDIVESN